MRVGIDLRIVGVGESLINRGMPRFTQQQLAAVLDHDRANEYVLLCNRGNDLSLIQERIRAAPNVSIREFTGERPQQGEPDPDTLLRRAEEYQQWIYDQEIDLYHSTTPFSFEEPQLVIHDACAMVATHYDLIPLIYPQHYLAGWPMREEYMRRLGFLTSANRLLAISEHSREDAIAYLGVPPDRVDVCSPIPDPCFQPLPDEVVEARLMAPGATRELPDRFLMLVSHLHHCKNLETFLQGYSLLPAALRRELPVVLACYLDQAAASVVGQLAGRYGVADDVVTSGLVPDAQLAALYNAATMMVHPSRYEGFGLPVVEAMRCGTPVITTTASSLPEVAGDAALLVDPDDPQAMADAIEAVFEDEDRRAVMRARGLDHVRKYSPENLARATLACYERALEPPILDEDRLRIAVWTPLPPLRSGVGDYSVELLRGLESRCEVEVFVDDGYLPNDELLARHHVHHFSAAPRRQVQRPFDIVVYQIGGSMFHHYMYEPLRRDPGVVVMHDLLWSHVLYTYFYDRDELSAFREELARLEGEDAARELDALDHRGWTDQSALWDLLHAHPMLDELVAASYAQIVHLESSAATLARRYPDARVEVVPMGVSDPRGHRPHLQAHAARRRLRVGPTQMLIGSFGAVHPVKRIDVCLKALSELVEDGIDAVLVVVGSALLPSYAEELRDLGASLGVSGRLRLTGHLERSQFDAALLACDVVVNLRSPSPSHMSATLTRGLAAGKPLIISDRPDWRGLPDQACLRVPVGSPDAPAGPEEVSALADHLTRLTRDPDLKRRMGAAARSYFEREATIEAMVKRYERVLLAVARHRPRAPIKSLSTAGS